MCRFFVTSGLKWDSTIPVSLLLSNTQCGIIINGSAFAASTIFPPEMLYEKLREERLVPGDLYVSNIPGVTVIL